MSPWWNKFFAHPHDILITSEEITVSQDGKPIATVKLGPLIAGEKFEARVGLKLKAWLDSVHGLNTHAANVWLSHSLLQYATLGIDARSMNATEITATLKAYWEDALDLPEQGLALTYQVQLNGRSIFSSCCDMALIEAIKDNLKKANWKVKKIAPQLVRTWNEAQKQIPDDDCYLLIHEDRVLSIGVWENGQWTAWANEGCENPDWAELSSRATRFSRHAGRKDCRSIPVWIYAPRLESTPGSAGLSNWSLLKPISCYEPEYLKEAT